MSTNIDFSKYNFKKLKLGKQTTIRLGEKKFSLGKAVFTVDGVASDLEPCISEIRILRFGDLGLSDAVADGFNSVEELRSELELCYAICISDFDPITVVRFNLKK